MSWDSRAVSADAAVTPIQSGMRVFVHGAAATPTLLLKALARRTDLSDVTLYHLHTTGPAPFADAEHAGRFFSVSLFTGLPLHQAIAEGRADYVPVFLSDIPALFTSRRLPLDIALVQVSPPDAHGYCTLGTSVDTALAAVRAANLVIAEVNRRMPRTHGNTLIHISRLHLFMVADRPLPERLPTPPTAVDDAIGEEVAKLVPDRATLQMGIGAIPDAALRRLTDTHDLGVHTEMFSDGIVGLVEAGVITNRYKKVHPGRIATSFVMGSQRVYRFVDDNPFVAFYPCDHTNDTSVIRKNESVVAINSAIEVDLSGQVVADSIGFRIYSGIGGQMDFHSRRGPVAERRADHCAAVDRRKRRLVADCPIDQAWRRRGDYARPRSLGGNRVRRGQSLGADRCANAPRRSSASRTPISGESSVPPWPKPAGQCLANLDGAPPRTRVGGSRAPSPRSAPSQPTMHKPHRAGPDSYATADSPRRGDPGSQAPVRVPDMMRRVLSGFSRTPFQTDPVPFRNDLIGRGFNSNRRPASEGPTLRDFALDVALQCPFQRRRKERT